MIRFQSLLIDTQNGNVKLIGVVIALNGSWVIQKIQWQETLRVWSVLHPELPNVKDLFPQHMLSRHYQKTLSKINDKAGTPI
jgi:hypothetical protein